MPSMFALGDRVIGNPTVATFAAFGSFAMLLLVDFAGPMRDRLRAQASLAVVSAALICLATLASRTTWLAATLMALVAFIVLFAGAVSSVLAAATTTLLLAFILPVRSPGRLPRSPSVWLAGAWHPARRCSLSRCSGPRPRATGCAAPGSPRAGRWRRDCAAESAHLLGGRSGRSEVEHDAAIATADTAVAALHGVFFATPYRPSGLSTAARAEVRVVDELKWLNAIIAEAAPRPHGPAISSRVCAVKSAAADVLECSGELLEQPGTRPEALRSARARLRGELVELERHTSLAFPVVEARPVGAAEDEIGGVVSALDPSFRAQELSFVVLAIARSVDLAAAAERRSWLAKVLGRQPRGLTGRLSAARQGAAAHVERHSVWLQNSLRGAAGLGLAVLVANLTGVQHGFWVVFGTLSVLRSSALNTGESIVRSLLGTTAGFIVGAMLVALIGADTTLLWLLLVPAVLLAGLAPTAFSFAAGQAAFTVTLLILFNILQPAGWRIGLVRIEDVALGSAVSLVVGLLFWPRGAGAALRTALAEAYIDSANTWHGPSSSGSVAATPAHRRGRRRPTRRFGRRPRPSDSMAPSVATWPSAAASRAAWPIWPP